MSDPWAQIAAEQAYYTPPLSQLKLKNTALIQDSVLLPGEENYYSKLIEKLHPPTDDE